MSWPPARPIEMTKKQGATGITTVAPYIAGQWGRGITGCRNDSEVPEVVPAVQKYFPEIFSRG